MKKTLVYLNKDCFTDTDLTVLKHLTKEFRVIWYYIHESIKNSSKISVDDALEYSRKYGIEVHIVDPKMRYRNPKNLFFYMRIAKEINRLHPDLVFHCDRDPYWNLAIMLVLKCKKIVLGVHDVKPHTYKKSISFLMEKYSRELAVHVHRYFTTFSSNQHKLLKEIYGKDSCMVGMSCKDFGKSKLESPNISNGVKLLFFGTINEYKGLDLLIVALENLFAKGISNMELTIAGKGISWKECESLIKTKGKYNLQVRFIDNKEIPDLMSSHHFLVLPYRDATQSGPLATAIAYELPVVAPNFGCFSEVYSNESAILYSQGHLEEALTKVSMFTDNQYSMMKKACIKIKEANSEEKVADNYIKYFNQLINLNIV